MNKRHDCCHVSAAARWKQHYSCLTHTKQSAWPSVNFNFLSGSRFEVPFIRPDTIRRQLRSSFGETAPRVNRFDSAAVTRCSDAFPVRRGRTDVANYLLRLARQITIDSTRANSCRPRLRRKRGYLDATACRKPFDPPTKYGVAQSRPTLLDTKIFYTTRKV